MHRYSSYDAVEEEEEEDLFVFNDTIEGPRAPAVKPRRVTEAEYDSTSAFPSFTVGMTPPPHPLVLMWV